MDILGKYAVSAGKSFLNADVWLQTKKLDMTFVNLANKKARRSRKVKGTHPAGNSISSCRPFCLYSYRHMA